jgi:hypothetical protein
MEKIPARVARARARSVQTLRRAIEAQLATLERGLPEDDVPTS